MSNYCVVFVTCNNKKEAGKIAKYILQEKIVACVNIISQINSIYWWKGKIEQSKESLLIIKTSKKCLDKLIKKIKQIHSYKIPEIIALDIIKGNKDYLDWITDSVKA